MATYYLRIKGKGSADTWYKVEAPTLAKAKKKLISGSAYAKQPGIIKDVLVRKTAPKYSHQI